jgi:short-subunit dehydrogenase
MKKILITGCSSGIGYNAAKYFAEKGYFVYATMRNINGKNAKAAYDLRNFAEQNSFKIEVLEIDVTSDESVRQAVSQISGVDVLINNAGAGFGGPVEAFSSKNCLDQLDLNIVGTLRMAKAVLPGMRARKCGLIIQVSSVAGRGAFPGFGIYHASKWGLEGVSEALRYELAPLGVDVVLVEPGPFDTHFFENMLPGTDSEVAGAYPHVTAFMKGFSAQTQGMFMENDTPTDPMLVVEAFGKLVELPAGTRPLRTIVGLDFGLQALNDASEPIRKAALASMGLSAFDGPSQKQKEKTLL